MLKQLSTVWPGGGICVEVLHILAGCVRNQLQLCFRAQHRLLAAPLIDTSKGSFAGLKILDIALSCMRW